MDKFFEKLDPSALTSLLAVTGLDRGLFFLVEESTLVFQQSPAAIYTFGDLHDQPFASLLSDRTARLLRLALREGIATSLAETIDGIAYTLSAQPTGAHTLLVLNACAQNETDAHALGIRPEVCLSQQIAQLLRLSACDNPDAQTMQEVRRAGLRMQREILHAALLREDNCLYGTPQTVDLSDLCRRVLARVATKTICALAFHGDTLQCTCNPQSMEIILYNIVCNAVQAHGVTQVDIFGEMQGANVHLRIEDNGKPLPQPRLSGAMAKAYHGMGLDVCRKLLLEQNGLLTFEETPQGGVCNLWLTLAAPISPNTFAQASMDFGQDFGEVMLSVLG